MWELGPDADEPEWQTVETPFSTDLFEVVNTTNGPYAVGDGGVLAADHGDGWEIITDAGPNASQNQLRSLAATDDGKRLWFLGSSGAIGCYDIETNRKSDYSFPMEKTSTWESIAVSGAAGEEKVLAGNGSGEILPFTIDGFDVNWGVVSKPDKQGATMSDLAADAEGYGYGIDTSGNVFKTTKDDSWERIGINNAQEKFYDIWGGQHGRVYVTAGNGRLYRYDDSYQDWTPVQITEQEPIHAFDLYDDQLAVVGGGGFMSQRIDGGERWEEVHTRTEETLNDLALGEPDFAVGKGGTVLRRPRGTTRESGTSPDGDNYDGRGEIYDPDQHAPDETGNSQSQTQNQGQNQNQSQGQSQPQKQNQPQTQDQTQSQGQSQPQEQNQTQAANQNQGLNQDQSDNQTQSQKQSQPQEQSRTQNQSQSQPQHQNQDDTASPSRAKPQGQDHATSQPQSQSHVQDQPQNQSQAQTPTPDQTQGQNQAQDRSNSQSQSRNQNQDQNMLSGVLDKVEQFAEELQDSEPDQEQSS